MKASLRVLALSGLLITACNGQMNDTTPPHIDHVSMPEKINPRVDVEIQAGDDQGMGKVQLYAKLATGDVLLGETKTAPYVIHPDTSRLPNQTNISVYIKASDATGNQAASIPTSVLIADDHAPALAYYAGFTYPASAVTAQSMKRAEPWNDVRPEVIRFPLVGEAATEFQRIPLAGHLRTQADTNRVRAVEWGWMPVASALGYNLYRGHDALGPYTRTRGIQPAQGTPLIRQAEFLSEDDADQPSYGLYSTLLPGGESPYSNASQAQFLPEQELVSPTDGENVIGGRPTLTWVPNPSKDVQGYLYFVYTKNPEQIRTTPIWASVDGQTTARTTAVYPSALDPLAPGIYYWRLAAVSFNSQGVANGFSYSKVRTFKVNP